MELSDKISVIGAIILLFELELVSLNIHLPYLFIEGIGTFLLAFGVGMRGERWFLSFGLGALLLAIFADPLISGIIPAPSRLNESALGNGALAFSLIAGYFIGEGIFKE